MAGQIGGYNNVSKFDEIWKSKTDVQKRMLEYCKTQKDVEADDCFAGLQMWGLDQMMNNNRNLGREEWDLLDSIMEEASNMRQALLGK